MKFDFDNLTQPLSEEDWTELASILNDDAWPDETLDLEGLDGLIAAGVCGPRHTNLTALLPLAFGLAEMPDFDSQDKLIRFLDLTGRRWNEYAQSLMMPPEEMSADNFTVPYLCEIDADDLATATAWTPPPRPGPEHWRPGDWMGRAWAEGFLRTVSADESWLDLLAQDEIYGQLFSPLLFLDLGFNPDHPRIPFEPLEWMGMATANLNRFAVLFRHLD